MDFGENRVSDVQHAVEPGGDRAGSCRALAVAGGGEKAASELSNSVPGRLWSSLWTLCRVK